MASSTWGKLKQGFFMSSEIHQSQQSVAESLLPGAFLHHSDQSRIYKELHLCSTHLTLASRQVHCLYLAFTRLLSTVEFNYLI